MALLVEESAVVALSTLMLGVYGMHFWFCEDGMLLDGVVFIEGRERMDQHKSAQICCMYVKAWSSLMSE